MREIKVVVRNTRNILKMHEISTRELWLEDCLILFAIWLPTAFCDTKHAWNMYDSRKTNVDWCLTQLQRTVSRLVFLYIHKMQNCRLIGRMDRTANNLLIDIISTPPSVHFFLRITCYHARTPFHPITILPIEFYILFIFDLCDIVSNNCVKNWMRWKRFHLK